MAFRVGMGWASIPKILQRGRARQVTQQQMIVSVNEALVFIANLMRKRSVNVTGVLVNSWQIDPARPRGTGVVGKVASAKIQALVLDQGADPHFPPVPADADPALGEWIRRKGSLVLRDPPISDLDPSNERDLKKIAFILSRAIRRRGFPRPGAAVKLGHFTFAFLKAEPAIARILSLGVSRAVSRLDSDS